MNNNCLFNKDIIFNPGKILFNHNTYKNISETLRGCDIVYGFYNFVKIK